jgi:plastocyanin
MRRSIATLCALALASMAGCTDGAPTAPSSALQAGAVKIHMGLTKYGPSQTPYGEVSGYSPNPLVVSQGTVIQFVNDDGFRHTGSYLSETSFPSVGPGAQALSPTGHDIGTPGWSTGDMVGGSASQTFVASTRGTFFYGCFHHYSLHPSMRGVIIVQ